VSASGVWVPLAKPAPHLTPQCDQERRGRLGQPLVALTKGANWNRGTRERTGLHRSKADCERRIARRDETSGASGAAISESHPVWCRSSARCCSSVSPDCSSPGAIQKAEHPLGFTRLSRFSFSCSR
jgi:hypothetical protein